MQVALLAPVAVGVVDPPVDGAAVLFVKVAFALSKGVAELTATAPALERPFDFQAGGPGVDVWLRGHAYARGSNPSGPLEARVHIASLVLPAAAEPREGETMARITQEPWCNVLDTLPPDATFLLENLSPQPLSPTRLPGKLPCLFVLPGGEEKSRRLRVRCDRLVIDADLGVVTITYRSRIPGDWVTSGARVIAAIEPADAPFKRSELLWRLRAAIWEDVSRLEVMSASPPESIGPMSSEAAPNSAAPLSTAPASVAPTSAGPSDMDTTTDISAVRAALEASMKKPAPPALKRARAETMDLAEFVAAGGVVDELSDDLESTRPRPQAGLAGLSSTTKLDADAIDLLNETSKMPAADNVDPTDS